MEKVLLAYDGSECARRALDYVLALVARQPGTSVHVLTAEPEPRLYGESAAYVQKEALDQAVLQEGGAIAAVAVAQLAAAGVTHQQEVLLGDASQLIAARAEAIGCTHIVMGSRGMGSVGNLLLGSVATKVLHRTQVPVTLIR
jgi:nucleotide-binding universal stress UspA family protein